MDKSSIKRLWRILEVNSKEESIDGRPWERGGSQQSDRIMMVANEAALEVSGDIVQITCQLSNATRGLAAVARVHNRRLSILIPRREEQITVIRTCPNQLTLELANQLDGLAPFKDVIDVHTRRSTWLAPEAICFALVDSPRDYSTYNYDINLISAAWLIAVENAAWEPNAMRAISASRYTHKRGLIQHWKNREGYLVPRN